MCLRKWRNKLLVLAFVQCFAVAPSMGTETPANEVDANGGDFTLSYRNGLLSLSDLRGKVVLMFFGYTACPDVCPVTLAVISKVFAEMTEDELDKVTALFVSVDPDRDTPELLDKYTGYFHPKIVGVTDRIDVIREVMQDYGVKYERKERPGSPLGYVIFHTPDILVVDRDGMLQKKRIPPSTKVKDITAYVRSLL